MTKSYIPAVVMNLFYTGLGIARNLGEMGIPVIGLGSQRSTYGNFSRFCKFLLCPDSRDQQEELLAFLLQLRKGQERCPVIFPTRDHDVIFLARYETELRDHFVIPMPGAEVIDSILNKWKMLEIASRCGVPIPRSYLLQSEADCQKLSEIPFPCVLKPVYAASWRAKGAWEAVGGRKAIAVFSLEELRAEYDRIRKIDKRAIVQELIQGGDDRLYILGSYLNADSEPLAYFTAQKLIQSPQDFGTGCLIEGVRLEQIEEPTFRLLQRLGYHGISEVEYKQDPSDGQFKLIEINPRHWDWHRLGTRCGVNLSYVAYRDLTGQPLPKRRVIARTGMKWIAEREFVFFVVKGLLEDGLSLRRVRELAKGSREYGTFAWNDPLPFIISFFQLAPLLLAALARRVRRSLRGETSRSE
jgi:D-aspartate ligase